MNYLADIPDTLHCTAKFRYRQNDQPVTIRKISETEVQVIYDKPIKSVTPGQEAVFYDGEVMIGGGVIDNVLKNKEDLMQKICLEALK